jgi:hypothetical protein
MEDLNFYYANYSRYVCFAPLGGSNANEGHYRIYNDVITLRKGSSFMFVIQKSAFHSAR